MKQNMLKKIIVAGIIFLFLGMISQTSLSIEIKKEVESNHDEDCDCKSVTNYDMPICKKIQQWIETFSQKLDNIVEKLEQYKHNPLLSRLFIFLSLFLMGRIIHFQSYWFLLGCNI
jgi:hypothetical protein